MNDLNVLLVSVDSLRRDFLGAYESPFDWVEDLDVRTPNFDRFAERATVFDTHYAGSLPCMPARREWLVGLQEFLWRPWGPIESFDTTLPAKLRRADVLTQLVTDHFHYFQHGSSGYFEDYHGFEFVRGHEDDAWRTSPHDPDGRLLRQVGYDWNSTGKDGGEESVGRDNPATDPHNLREIRPRWSYVRNVETFDDETDFFAPKVFSRAAKWLRANTEWDRWFCYVDEFDVHEPFHCPEPYASMYTDEDPLDPDLPVWPYYGRVDEGQAALTERELSFVRSQFAGKVTMVDRWFGRLLDTLDDLGAWDETMMVVTSDHGHFLGDHGWIGKPSAPDYDVLARTPLMIWDPNGTHNGERLDVLTSAVDLHATVLDALDAGPPDHDHSKSLLQLLRGERSDHRDWALYGWWGSAVSVTDGRYTYMQPCREDAFVNCYSTHQMEPWGWMGPTTPKVDAEVGSLPYTDVPVWQFTAPPDPCHESSLLFDTKADPTQDEDLTAEDEAAVTELRDLMIEAMETLNAPDAQYDRLCLATDR